VLGLGLGAATLCGVPACNAILGNEEGHDICTDHFGLHVRARPHAELSLTEFRGDRTYLGMDVTQRKPMP